MFKKTLISLAVASSLGLTGCLDSGSDNKNANPSPKYTDESINGTWLVFNPATRQIPTPTDLSFSGSKDGTFKIDLTEDSPPPAVALDSLSGASTIEPIVLRTNGQLPATAEAANLIPNQTVFLIPLKYASGDPIQGLSNQEPPTVDTSKLNIGQTGITPNFKVDILELDGKSAIRIVPTEPLAPNTRYVVGITKAVKDATGQTLIQDPVYRNITSETDPLLSQQLAGVRALANRIWEPTIIGFADLATGGALKLEQEDVALSYSLTTSNDVKVLSYIANPELWLRDQVKNFVKVSVAKQVKAPATFDDVDAAVTAALNNFKPTEALKNAQLAPCDEVNSTTGLYEFGPLGSFDDQFACVAAGLAAAIDGALPAEMEIAEPDSRDITLGTSVPAQQKSAVLVSITGSDLVSVNESSIKLPYHLGQPTAQDGSPIQGKAWTADTAFAAELNKVFKNAGLVLPQGAGVSEVVNSIFPFPASTGDIEVPMLIIHPTSQTPSAGAFDDVVIFQHGITTDRSAALAFGSALVAAGLQQGKQIAVVAIDQPLHGVSPATREEKESTAKALLNGVQDSTTIDPNVKPLLTASEANIDAAVEGTLLDQVLTQVIAGTLAADPNTAPLATQADLIASGVKQRVLTGTYTPTGNANIDGAVTNFASDTNIQLLVGTLAVAQQTTANSGSTIPGLVAASTSAGVNETGITERHFGWGSNPDYDRTLDVGPGNLPWAPMQFNPADDVEEAGASGDLFINLGNFLSSRDNLRQGALDLLNLRASLPVEVPAFAGATFHFVGHSLGTINGNAFVMAANASGRDDLAIANSHLIAPASGIVRMLESSPSFAPTILAGLNQQAGLTQQNADLQSFFGVLQAAIDTVDPINYAEAMQGSRTLISQIDGDRTTVNAAFEFYIGEAAADGFDTQWPEGYKPLKVGVGNLTINSSDSPLAGSEALAAWSDVDITRYAVGTHGTPVLPREEKAEAPNLAEFEFDFLKNRQLAEGGEVIVSASDAKATFAGLIGSTLQMILTP